MAPYKKEDRQVCQHTAVSRKQMSQLMEDLVRVMLKEFKDQGEYFRWWKLAFKSLPFATASSNKSAQHFRFGTLVETFKTILKLQFGFLGFMISKKQRGSLFLLCSHVIPFSHHIRIHI